MISYTYTNDFWKFIHFNELDDPNFERQISSPNYAIYDSYEMDWTVVQRGANQGGRGYLSPLVYRRSLGGFAACTRCEVVSENWTQRG
jgi:hypothetical protein